MDTQYIDARFWTEMLENDAEGWTANELFAEQGDSGAVKVGRIVYWDANGKFTISILIHELPLSIVSEFIDETKARVRRA